MKYVLKSSLRLYLNVASKCWYLDLTSHRTVYSFADCCNNKNFPTKSTKISNALKRSTQRRSLIIEIKSNAIDFSAVHMINDDNVGGWEEGMQVVRANLKRVCVCCVCVYWRRRIRGCFLINTLPSFDNRWQRLLCDDIYQVSGNMYYSIVVLALK